MIIPGFGGFASAAASAFPEIKSYTAATPSFSAGLNIAVGATDAADEILVVGIYNNSNTITMPANMTLVADVRCNNERMALYKWDGTGTRPNSSSVLMTPNAASNCGGYSFVLSGASGIGTPSTVSNNVASGHSSAALTTAGNNSLVLHLVGHTDTAATYSAPSPLPTTSPSLPDTEGFWEYSTIFDALIVEQATAGLAPTVTISTGYSVGAFIAVEIQA